MTDQPQAELAQNLIEFQATLEIVSIWVSVAIIRAKKGKISPEAAKLLNRMMKSIKSPVTIEREADEKVTETLSSAFAPIGIQFIDSIIEDIDNGKDYSPSLVKYWAQTYGLTDPSLIMDNILE